MRKIRLIGSSIISSIIISSWLPASELWVDTSNRSEVIKFYIENYLPSEGFESRHEWNGSIEGQDPGTLSDRIHQDVIMRVNYFRAMAGLNANIGLSVDLNNKAQEAAFMMAYQNELSHYPTSDWKYYSEEGAIAAKNSNLSLGFNLPYYGPAAIDGQIEDDGDNNQNLGHRRWILYSRAPLLMGHGSIPLNYIINHPEPEPEPVNRNSSMALWIIGEAPKINPDNLDFIAWPPAGYVPHQVVYNRWSFAIPNSQENAADFSLANVAVRKNGEEIPSTIIYRGNPSEGNDPTIAFELNDEDLVLKNNLDQKYSVTVSNIIGSEQNEYHYEVTIIDPMHLNLIQIEGPDIVYEDTTNVFNFKPISAAKMYQLLVSNSVKIDWLEDAENTEDLKIQNNSIGAENIIVDDINTQGSKSFHLVNNNDYFEINNEVIPTQNSILKFENYFRYVGDGTSLKIEIQDESGSWREIWQRYGKHGYQVIVGDWDPNWNTTEVPIGHYEDQKIRIRFVYEYESGANWTPLPGENPLEMGAFIDNIQLTDCYELIPLESQTIDPVNDAFELTDINNGMYWLKMRAKISNQWFNFSLSKSTLKAEGLKPEIIITQFNKTDNAYRIDFTSKGLKHLYLQTSEDGGINWEPFMNKDLLTEDKKTYRFEFVEPNQRSIIYRVIGDKEK